MASNVLIGTSGYDYPEWKGAFYPPDLKRADFLSWYSTKFNALELNSTFYSLPDASRMESFALRSEGRLSFSVKASRLLTHEVSSSWEAVAADFKAALKPLYERNLLSAVLFQLPQSFHYTTPNRFYLADLVKEFEGFPVVMEFRHREWIRPSVFEGLVRRNASVAFCDMPDLKALPDGKSHMKLYTQFIGPEAYIRLHGRNGKAWYAAASDSHDNGSARYEYEYSKAELEEFVPVIKAAQEEGRKVQVFFNNHPKGHGARNAAELKQMLES